VAIRKVDKRYITSIAIEVKKNLIFQAAMQLFPRMTSWPIPNSHGKDAVGAFHRA
jgi:hypothetical protein